jgi:hypothetical protein
VEFVVLLGVGGYLYLRSRRQSVDAHNVTDAWEVDQATAPNVPSDLITGGTR